MDSLGALLNGAAGKGADRLILREAGMLRVEDNSRGCALALICVPARQRAAFRAVPAIHWADVLVTTCSAVSRVTVDRILQ